VVYILLLFLKSVFVLASDAEVNSICKWADQKYLTVSEFKNGRLQRQYLTQGECNKNTLEIKFEKESLLQLTESDSATGPSSDVLLKFDRLRAMKTHWRLDQGQIRLAPVTSPFTFELRPLIENLNFEETKSAKWPVRAFRQGKLVEKDIPVSGRFAVNRKGHRVHTALDIPTSPGEDILSTGPGIVTMISHLKTQKTVFVKHKNEEGSFFYSAYAHLKEPNVQIGQVVDENTVLARAMEKNEWAQTKHLYNHVHFEVRKDLQDHGHFSISTKNRKQLTSVFADPLLVLKGKWKW